MRNKISAIIIDHDYKSHDYAGVKYDDGGEYSERHFQLKILENGANIMEEIWKFRGVDAIITIGDDSDWTFLGLMPYEYRKKWTHINEFDAEQITANILSTFMGNIQRGGAPTKFSFFTSTYNTGLEKLSRLHNSMLEQTYAEWNWFIIDDSTDGETAEIIESFHDPRITVIRNCSVHGNIGFNKHTVAMMCDGDYLIEADHDDEFTFDCLETLLGAIKEYPASDFFYSNCLELKGADKEAIIYGDGWGWGEGLTKTEVVKGQEYTFSESPGVNPFSIRTIYAQPNHLRCWKRDFYHKIGGHNPEMSVLDDQELLIRTFLSGEMTKIDKVLYIQYESDGERGKNEDNTQSMRFAEIQRTTFLLKKRFDEDIHKRILELGYKDIAWDNGLGYSVLWKKHEPGQEMMNNFYIP